MCTVKLLLRVPYGSESIARLMCDDRVMYVRQSAQGQGAVSNVEILVFEIYLLLWSPSERAIVCVKQ